MAITQATSSVLAANAALNNLNAGASIVFTKQVIIPSLSGAAFGTGVITALAATANTGSGLVTVDGTATLTNKTLTTPTIAQINAQGNNPLAIVGNTISQDGILSIRNSNSQQNSVVRFNDWTSGSRGVVGIGNTSSALYPSTIYMQGTAGVPLVLGTNDTERLRILSGGQVGIGTSTPNSTAVLELSSTTRGFLPPRMSTTERDAITSPPDGLVIHNTTTNKPNVRSAGAWIEVAAGLGIGVAEFLASPTSDNLRAAVTNETGTEALVFANGPTLIAPNIGAATGTSLALSGDLTVDTNTLFVDSVNNRVGIGTATLGTAKLVIRNDNDSANWLLQTQNDNGNTNSLFTQNGAGDFVWFAYRNGTAVGSPELSLHTNGNSFFNGGNVGIGTTTPNERLTVSGNLSASNDVRANKLGLGATSLPAGVTLGVGPNIIDDSNLPVQYSSTTAINYIGLNAQGSGYGGLVGFTQSEFGGGLILRTVQSGSGVSNIIFITQNANERMRIVGTSGNVGIGTLTPNERLTVSGNLSASGDAFASGSKLSTETFAIAMAIAIG